MLVLLSLSIASASPGEPTSQTEAQRALLQTATTCCVVIIEEYTLTYLEVDSSGDSLRLVPGFRRLGGIDTLGGTPLTEQAVMLDDVPMMIDGRLGPGFERTGTRRVAHNVGPGPVRQ